MQVEVEVEFESKRYLLEVESVSEPVLTLKLQLFSIVDVPPERIVLVEPMHSQEITDQTPIGTHKKLWAFEGESVPEFVIEQLNWENCCTRVYFGDLKLNQPLVKVNNQPICVGCANSCLQMLPKAHFTEKISAACECQSAGSICLFQSRIESNFEKLVGGYQKKLIYKIRAAFEKHHSAIAQGQYKQMENKILTYAESIYDFENPENQRKARAVIPLDVLEKRAKENENPLPGRDELLRQLLHWFKREFFRWVNSPECEACKAETFSVGADSPNPEERTFRAGVVEVYKCKVCGKLSRFPRYNHSGKLMETRRGRCGEWAQAFTLCCRALGFEARFVVDWTDHVWTEVFSDSLQRWVHCDPCEDAYDSPFMYECGWGKKLTYLIAFSKDEIRDVSKRYTRSYPEMLKHRNQCPEQWLFEFIDRLANQRLSKLPRDRQEIVQSRWKREKEELESNLSDEDRKLKDSETIGRLTGSLEWRKNRGELGKVAAEDVEHKQSASPENPPLDLKALIQSYYKQLSQGCSNPENPNHSKFCRHSKTFANTSTTTDPQQLLKEAIRIVREFNSSALCSK